MSLFILQIGACETFKVHTIFATTKRWEGDIRLIKSLDYERKRSYEMSLNATVSTI